MGNALCKNASAAAAADPAFDAPTARPSDAGDDSDAGGGGGGGGGNNAGADDARSVVGRETRDPTRDAEQTAAAAAASAASAALDAKLAAALVAAKQRRQQERARRAAAANASSSAAAAAPSSPPPSSPTAAAAAPEYSFNELLLKFPRLAVGFRRCRQVFDAIADAEEREQQDAARLAAAAIAGAAAAGGGRVGALKRGGAGSGGAPSPAPPPAADAAANAAPPPAAAPSSRADRGLSGTRSIDLRTFLEKAPAALGIEPSAFAGGGENDGDDGNANANANAANKKKTHHAPKSSAKTHNHNHQSAAVVPRALTGDAEVDAPLLSAEELADIFTAADIDGSTRLDAYEFVLVFVVIHLLHPRRASAKALPREVLDALSIVEEAFCCFLDASSDGHLGRADVARALCRSNTPGRATARLGERLFASLDLDGNAQLSFKEFLVGLERMVMEEYDEEDEEEEEEDGEGEGAGEREASGGAGGGGDGKGAAGQGGGVGNDSAVFDGPVRATRATVTAAVAVAPRDED